MYVPAQFKPASDNATQEFIRNHSFAILVKSHDSIPKACHIPVEVENDENENLILYGHIAASNPIGTYLEHEESLVIFHGPHAYVSSSWYSHINVPTWNYIAVHAYGKAKIMNQDESAHFMQRQLNRYEQHSDQPVTFSSMPKDFLETHLKGIICFRMPVNRLESAFKLSQNRNDADYAEIIRRLKNSGNPDSTAVAEHMKRLRPHLE